MLYCVALIRVAVNTGFPFFLPSSFQPRCFSTQQIFQYNLDQIKKIQSNLKYETGRYILQGLGVAQAAVTKGWS